ALGHLLFGRPAVAGLPDDQPPQPLLLRHLRLPLWLPGGDRLAADGRSGRPAGPQPRPVGGLLRASQERLEDQELRRITYGISRVGFGGAARARQEMLNRS